MRLIISIVNDLPQCVVCFDGSTDHKCGNRIKLSQLGQHLFYFFVSLHDSYTPTNLSIGGKFPQITNL